VSYTDEELQDIASEIASEMVAAARNSIDPVVFVTGNSYFPPLRWFEAAERVWQAEELQGDETGDAWAYLTELVESILTDSEVYLGCPDYDNALYVVDLRRFVYADNPDAETLSDDLSDEWVPIDGGRETRKLMAEWETVPDENTETYWRYGRNTPR
jgi:hypothetical protein